MAKKMQNIRGIGASRTDIAQHAFDPLMANPPPTQKALVAAIQRVKDMNLSCRRPSIQEMDATIRWIQLQTFNTGTF